MPKRNDNALLPYDLGAWRTRMDWSQDQCADALGISVSSLWRYERDGKVTKTIAWACYGIERHLADQKK